MVSTSQASAPSIRESLLGSLQWRLIGPHRGGRVVAVAGDVSDPAIFYFGACAGGVWKTTDGGTTWRNVSDGYFNTAAVGAIAVSPSDPNVVYAGTGEACIRNNVSHGDGVYKSTDGGKSWQHLGLADTRHIGKILVHPHDPDVVYVAALGHAFGPNEERGVFRSTDGGRSWQKVLYKSPRAGSPDLSMDPHNPRRMIEGNDGGACVTYNGGASWSTIFNQPTAQLYHVTTDDQVPYRVYGSQQDNTAISVPSRSVDGAIHERDWFAPGGGESGYIAVKPDDPNVVVGAGPAGRRYFNDYISVYDRRTHQKRNVTVWPELYGWGVGAEGLKHRFQWTFPIHFSRHDPSVLYAAGNRLFRSTDLGGSWEPISDDLTRNDPSRLGPSGGPITRDNTGAEVYCTIFALTESPLSAGLLWAGSDDGLVHLSEDGGESWRNVTPPDLPEWALISIVEASPHDPATAYLAATRYKLDDTRPYLYKTSDYGATWTLITGGIPDHEFTRVVREDPNRRGLLYAGTETGLYVSLDDGVDWQRLGGNLPTVPIYDLVIKGVELVVATHGRSFWILDDLTPLHELKDGIDAAPVHLFQPRPTVRMRIYHGFGGNDLTPAMTNFQGVDTSQVWFVPTKKPDDSFERHHLNVGVNPPEGVAIHYYLEERPSDGARLTLLDDAGAELRSFTTADDKLPAEGGLNRFVWNMRLPGVPNVEGDDLEPWHRPDGPMVLPGAYQVRRTAGDQAVTQRFEIEPDPRIQTSRSGETGAPLNSQDLEAQLDLLQQILAKLGLANQTLNRIGGLLDQVELWKRRVGDREEAEAVRAAAASLEDELRGVRGELIDVHMKESQLWPSGLHEKLNALFDCVDSADYAPTQQSRNAFTELSTQLDGLVGKLDRTVEEKGRQLHAAIQAAGLPSIG